MKRKAEAFCKLKLALLCVLSLQAQQRIVSTAPVITETLFAIGAGDRVVAVSDYCHYPAEAATRPKIGSYLRPNVEAIVRLRPDLAIVERLPNSVLDQLKVAGINVVSVGVGDVEQNLKTMDTIAGAVGLADRGRKLTAGIREELASMRKANAGKPTKSMVFIVGRVPGRLEGLIAVGKGSYLNELMAVAGGKNLFSDAATAYAKISLEAIVRMKPAIILDMGEMAQTVGITDEHKRAVEALWKSRRDVPSRVQAVADDIFVVPGPRMVNAARAFHSIIHAQP
jgi:iron complex transport system substrate-binding protein